MLQYCHLATFYIHCTSVRISPKTIFRAHVTCVIGFFISLHNYANIGPILSDITGFNYCLEKQKQIY